MRLPTIFVQIASYRDPECQWTVKDLFEKAVFPGRVFVGQCLQVDPVEDAHCGEVPSPRPDQTRTISVLPTESLGVCWARAQTQTLYQGEDYVLMIDSHMRFIEGWDRALIHELDRCQTEQGHSEYNKSEKPILSTYPPPYTPPNTLTENPKPSIMHAKPIDEHGKLRFKALNLNKRPKQPLRGAFIAAGFLFTKGTFINEVPYDPFLYFANEEVCMSARAYTHGWDVYSPSTVFVYHYYYIKSETENRNLHWDDNSNWQALTRQSRDRYYHLVCRKQDNISPEALQELEKYGLGTIRSIESYEDFCGIDFVRQTVSRKALKGLFIDRLMSYL